MADIHTEMHWTKLIFNMVLYMGQMSFSKKKLAKRLERQTIGSQ